MSASEYNLIL
jgi:hypothetical protein